MDNKETEITIRNDIGLYYSENNKNYSLRYDLKYSYDNSIDNYMLFSYDIVGLNEFSKKDISDMKKTEYSGKFIYKVVLSDGSILNHYYTFIGFENSKELKLVPVKLLKKNKYTVDPQKVISTTWYYIPTKEKNFIELSELLLEFENSETENSETETKETETETKKTKKETKK